MSKSMSAFGPWVQTRNVISTVLGLSWDFANASAYSEDPNSDFVRINEVIDQLLDLLKQHALIGLRQIDETIADAGLIEELRRLSSEAKLETDRIKNATRDINKFAKVVGKVTEIVAKIPGLPFV